MPIPLIVLLILFVVLVPLGVAVRHKVVVNKFPNIVGYETSVRDDGIYYVASVYCEYVVADNRDVSGYIEAFVKACVQECIDARPRSFDSCSYEEGELRRKVRNGIDRYGGSVVKLSTKVDWYV